MVHTKSASGQSTAVASPLELGGLAFDDAMVGLTLDDVCVVLVADRPVLVPVSAELSERSGLTVIAVNDATLLALGILPRRTPADVADRLISAASGTLASGRPVNLVDPAELILRGEAVDDSDLIIELRDVATISLVPMTLTIAATSLTGVSGPRGSGKTSLLRLLAGFDAPTRGSGLVGGERLESIRPDDRAPREAISSGFIPQTPFLVPDLTVAENVELPLLATGASTALARATAQKTLDLVGLGQVIDLPAAVLSGAEVRLAAVARALVSSPEIVFADEPFAGLSDEDAATVLACLHDVVADGGTVIVTCTDPRARLHGVRQLVLDRGRLLSDEVAFATH